MPIEGQSSTPIDNGTVRGMLEARLAAYAAAASDTRRLLEIADRAGADD